MLDHRVRYASAAALDEATSRDHRAKALAALERYAPSPPFPPHPLIPISPPSYFFLISFASFAQETDFKVKFSAWLKHRAEVAKMISRMRKTGHFFVFSPVNDLSLIAKGDAANLVASKDLKQDVQRNGGEVIGDEWARQIVRVRFPPFVRCGVGADDGWLQDRSGIILRTGLILKNDQWRSMSQETEEEEPNAVRGAINFRRVPNSSLYGLSQPTQDGIERVLENVRSEMKEGSKIVWINLREEPLLYIKSVSFQLSEFGSH